MSKSDLSKLDLVYPLRSIVSPCEDLRHSLRSACENLPHREIYIVGKYLPDWLDATKVHQLPIADDNYGRGHKAVNVGAKLQAVCENPDISDPFILMNDDFFALQKIADIPYYAWGEIYQHLKVLLGRNDSVSQYMRIVIEAADYLCSNGYTTYDFGIHAPLIVDKATMLKVLDLGELGLYRRTVYCNIKGVKPTIVEDFKCIDSNRCVDFSRPFVSTSDAAFAHGVAGRELRERFNKPCKYEKEVKR